MCLPRALFFLENTPQHFSSMDLLEFVNVHRFAPLQAPVVLCLPQALFLFCKKHAPGCLERVCVAGVFMHLAMLRRF